MKPKEMAVGTLRLALPSHGPVHVLFQALDKFTGRLAIFVDLDLNLRCHLPLGIFPYGPELAADLLEICFCLEGHRAVPAVSTFAAVD